MADTPDFAVAPDPFEAAVADLAARLRELGATPQQATRAAAETVARTSITKPSPMQMPDATGVTAGQYGLPPMVDYSRNALAGPEMRSTNTPMGDMVGAYDTGLGALASKAERGAGYVTRGAAELTGVPQAVRAGEALGDAMLDPSLASVTNAGTQSALAVGRPLAAAGTLGAGYLTAGAKDLGVFDTAANAQQPKRDAAELPGLPPAANAEYNKLKAQAKRGFATYDDRDNALRRIRELEKLSNDMLMEGAKTANQGERDKVLAEEARKTAAETARLDEYNRAVKTAETVRDTELARNRRFSDTEVGKMWDKTGGAAPFAIAVPMGAVTRMATGGKTTMDKWGTPLLVGGAEGVAASNIPLAYNSFVTEPDNPEKRAYSAYARELPPDHPRKAEYAAYAAGLEDKNPVRKAASEEMYDLQKAMERGFFGGVEGAAGALLGNKLVGATSRYSGRAAPSVAASRLDGEASALERNALAGPPGAVSATAANRPASAATDVPLNPLATGLMPARLRDQTGSVSAPGQQLGSEALSNRPPSEILGSIQRAPRDVPTSFPQSTSAATPAPARPANMPEWASEPPQGVKLKPGQWWHGTLNQPMTEAGKFAEMPKYKASRPKAEKPAQDSGAIPEKPSVQVDDMAPYGRRRLDE